MRTAVATPDPHNAGLRLFHLGTNYAATVCPTVRFSVDVPYVTTLPCPGAAPVPLITTWKA